MKNGPIRNGKRVTSAHQSLTFSRRMLLTGGAQVAVGAVLIGRLGWLSVAENEHYQLLSESNRVQLITVPPRRGWIVDRKGTPIAINRSDFRVDIIPEQLENVEQTLATLARLLDLSVDDVDRILKDLKAARGYQPVQVAENVRYENYAAVTVRLPELPGVQPMRGFSRFYPDGPAVAHLVGYVGTASAKDYEREKNPLLITPGFKIGKEGLEKTLESDLRGMPGGQRVELSARGKLVRELEPKPDRSGNTVQLTIDAGLQQYAARRLGPQSGSVVVLDCHTGDILAFVSMPAYDPNSFSQGIGRTEWKMLSDDDHLPLLNKVTQGLYPSGSTIKPLMSLAFLEAGIDPDRHVVCRGSYRVGNGIFHCDKVHGSVDMHTAIEKSCDIFFYDTGLRAGADIIASMARRLGFGQHFELPVTSQRYGTVPDPEWMERKYHRKWQAYDTINMSIGQGNILVNPLQLALMGGRIASGKSIQPRLLIGEKTPPVQPLPVSAEHLVFVREAMSAVVNSGAGTASVAKLPIDGVLLAGKTGTAQVRRITMAERAGGVRSNESMAWKMRDHSLFVGFAPVEQPRYACGVIVEHGGWGAAVAAPICRDTLTFLYDRDKAMAALAPMEEQWGGTLAERTARRATAIEAAAQAALVKRPA
jgi:penicillin-binding protein 2